jgi:hypothetical protein
MDVEGKQIGPKLVHLTLGTLLGRCVLVQIVTPIASFTQRVLHRLYASPTVIALYAKLILWGEAVSRYYLSDGFGKLLFLLKLGIGLF